VSGFCHCHPMLIKAIDVAEQQTYHNGLASSTPLFKKVKPEVDRFRTFAQGKDPLKMFKAADLATGSR